MNFFRNDGVYSLLVVTMASLLVSACGGESDSSDDGGSREWQDRDSNTNSATGGGSGGKASSSLIAARGGDTSSADTAPNASSVASGGSPGVSSSLPGGTKPNTTSPSQSADCSPLVGCGGDITGTWNLENYCNTSAAMVSSGLPAECANSLVDFSTNSTSIVTFNPDGTFRAAVGDGTTSFTFRYSAACISAMSGASITAANLPAACAAMGADASDELGDGPQGTCVMSGDVCECDLEVAIEADSITGTYTTQGSTVTTIESDSGEESVSTYCVSGNTLKTSDTVEPGLIVVYKK